MNIITMLASGVGNRFGGDVPKQFTMIKGKMLIEYVIDAVVESKSVDKIIIATDVEANESILGDICKKHNIDLIQGGDTRNRSLQCVLDYIKKTYDCQKLIVVDAVRPMITGELMDEYFARLDNADTVVTAQKVTDSLGCYDMHTCDRERYYLMSSPEGFRFDYLYNHYDCESKLVEVTQQFPEDCKVDLYFGFRNNMKLTYPEDLALLEALIEHKNSQNK
ncbi:2-C-methyl-D-erythritol 4-phosphate cytidylyltransferase [Eubacterium sp.]|uniref:2-C-methyl-D-erythritol 4-phosphate cytidylyltransferase n=1 Tax=uncultured Eubacterium sp. TaxID=165185 RepID=UPI0025CF12B1|nr:2-C-methyl-D-erythritol 4-phosphate cytidylyltransferase [uncultured Eubacterium sp.]